MIRDSLHICVTRNTDLDSKALLKLWWRIITCQTQNYRALILQVEPKNRFISSTVITLTWLICKRINYIHHQKRFTAYDFVCHFVSSKSRLMPIIRFNYINKQECIPAGCVPTAALASTRFQYHWWTYPLRGRHPLEGTWDHTARQEVTSYTPSPLNRLTNPLKTLPSLAVGKRDH